MGSDVFVDHEQHDEDVYDELGSPPGSYFFASSPKPFYTRIRYKARIMRVITKNMVNFLNKVTVNGTMLSDILLVFGEDGMHVIGTNEAHTGAVHGILFKDQNFVEYEEGLRVPLRDTSRLISMLKMVEGAAKLSVDNNTFKISSDNFDGSIIMTTEKYLNCVTPKGTYPDLGYDRVLEVDGGIFKQVKKAVQELNKKGSGDLIGRIVRARISGGIFSIQVGDETTDREVLKEAVDDDRDIFADYGPMLLDLAQVISGPVSICFNVDYPLEITSKEEGIHEIRWMVSNVSEVK